MKRKIFFKIWLLVILIGYPLTMSPAYISYDINKILYQPKVIEPLYNNVWGTIYYAEQAQCDNTPTITGDGSKINPIKASGHRWIAISQEMLNCEYRMRLLNDNDSPLYRGKIEYGDTIWIKSPNKNINGWWVVHDAKNKRYRNSIDFLQTKGDASLYDNNPRWSGKFDSIQIYKYEDVKKINSFNKIS